MLFKEQSLQQLKIRKTIWQWSQQKKVQRNCCWQKFISFGQLSRALQKTMIYFAVGQTLGTEIVLHDLWEHYIDGLAERARQRFVHTSFASTGYHWVHFPLYFPKLTLACNYYHLEGSVILYIYIYISICLYRYISMIVAIACE